MTAVETQAVQSPYAEKPRTWSRWAPPVITVAAGLLCYGLFYNRGAWLSVIGYSVSPAERVVQGEVPYRDFLYNYTPGILWLNAFLMRVFGTGLLSVHIGLFAFKLAALVALYAAGKKLLGSWPALVPVLLALSWIGYKYIFGVFPTQYSMVFVMTGLISMLKYDEGEKGRWMLLSGISIGVVFLFKYNVGILLFGCGTVAVVARQLALDGAPVAKRLVAALKPALLYWAGFALPLLSLLAYLVANQALGAMLSHFFLHVSAYSGERKVPLPPVKQLIPVLSGIAVVVPGAWLMLRKAPGMFRAYLLLIFLLAVIALLIPGRAYVVKNSAVAFVSFLPFFLFAAIAVFSAWQWRKVEGACRQQSADEQNRDENHPLTPSPRSAWWRRDGSTVIVALFALGTYLEIYPRADTYHVVRALPPTFLLIAMLFARSLPALRSYLERYTPESRREAVYCAAVPVALLVIVGFTNTWQPNFDSRFRFKDRAPLAIERGEGILVPPKQAEFIKDLTGLIQMNSTPDDYIFSFGQRGAGFYFLSGRRNPSRFVWWRNVGIKGEDREAALRMVGEKRSKLILLQDSLQDRRIREIVGANYHVVGWTNGIAVYDRNQ